MKQISNIKNNTASPCSTNSLFKYVFHYNHGLGGTSKFPQVAYSQDFINEKKQFRKGITPDFKNQWRAFVEDIDFDDEVFKWFANVYPLTEEGLTLIYVGNTEMQKIRKKINDDILIKNAIISLCNKHKVFWTKIQEQASFGKEVKCDLTPKFSPQLEKLNGLVACVNYWKKHLIPRGLCEIQVYDNLMTTSQNLIKTIKIE
ncbi:MAG: hypothetical protein H7339_05040 [Arcicella sp.]|nr:hypothetical protein [Arcicella sp.]